MSEEADFDPDANVPIWVNVVVPIVMGLLFLLTLVVLYHTDKEIPVEKLEEWTEKIPLVNKWFSNEETCGENDSASGKSKTNTKIGEKSKIRKSSSWHNVRRYDSISTIRSHGNSNSDKESDSTVRKPYFYASQGTLVSFESNV